MKSNLSQLERDMLIAQRIREISDLYNNLVQSVGTVKGIADENKRQLSRILNLPKGDKGDRGEMGPRGLQGKPGKDGVDGKDGFTPKKGLDYFTESEKEQIIQGVIKQIKLPKDGKDAIIDEEKIAKLAAEMIREGQLLGIKDIKGVDETMSSYRHQMAMKQAGQHGGGMTLEAGSNISLVAQTNGTYLISATGAGTGTVTDFIFTDANGFTGTVTSSTTTPTLELDISGLDASKIADGSVSDTEFQYLNGVTSAIQTQIDAKMTNPMTTGGDLIYGGASGTPTRLANGTAGQVLTSNGTTLAPTWEDATGGGNVSNTGTPLNNQIAVWTDATTIEGDADLTFDTATNTLATGILQSSSLTASEIVITDGSKNLVSAAVATYPSLTELTYVKGVTSAIQTQLNAKQATITFGTGVETALGVNVGSAGSIVVNGGALGTPSSGTLTNATGLPISTGVSGLGTGVATALAVNVGSAGAFVVNGGALGTPSSGTVTNLTGTASININGTVGATTPTTATFTTATINTVLNPDIDGGAGLGSATLGFSILGLSSGSTINFANSNVVLTHSSGILTMGTGDLRVTTAGTNSASVVTVGGTQTLSNKTFTSPTLNNGIWNEPTFSYTVEPSTDDTYKGDIIQGLLAGDTIAQWDLVYLDATSGRWELADADAVGTAGSVLLGLATTSGTDGNSLIVLARGIVRNDGWTWATVGGPLYASTTAAAMTQTAPSATDDVIRVIGYAFSDDCVWFNPSNDWITHT